MILCPKCEEECEMQTIIVGYRSCDTDEVPVCINEKCENYDEEVIIEEDYDEA
ncbi:MAG: hypothetical protein ACTSU7_00115 [Candidatus Heimdallarchaeaceae archaeon]